MNVAVRSRIMPRMPSADSVWRFIYGLAPSYFRTNGIGVDASFVEQTDYLLKKFSRVTALRQGIITEVYVCSRHPSAAAKSVQCCRVVFKDTVMGVVSGRMAWKIPVCEPCNDTVSLDITDPILIDNARRADGYVEIPVRTLAFLEAYVKAAN